MADTTYERGAPMIPSPVVHRLSLAGIFIGAFSALGLGLLFLSFGAALGVLRLGQTGGGSPVGAAIWTLVSVFVASYLGAGAGVRASGLAYRRDGGMQGMVTWALSFVMTILFVGLLVSGAAAGAGAILGASPGAAQGAQGAVNPSVFGAASWSLFFAAVAGLIGAILGGLSGIPVHGESEKPFGLRHRLREREA